MIMGTVECQETVSCTSFLGSLATFHTVRKPKNQAVMLILVVSRVNKRPFLRVERLLTEHTRRYAMAIFSGSWKFVVYAIKARCVEEEAREHISGSVRGLYWPAEASGSARAGKIPARQVEQGERQV